MTITEQAAAGVTISGQAVELVGAEGYIHGFICVRPPCGKKPGKVSASELSVRSDGLVVHKPSGWGLGQVSRSGSGWQAGHAADGSVTGHGAKVDAVKAVARKYNQGPVAPAADVAAPASAPAKPVLPAVKAKSPVKPAVPPPPPPPPPAKDASRPQVNPGRPESPSDLPPVPTDKHVTDSSGLPFSQKMTVAYYIQGTGERAINDALRSGTSSGALLPSYPGIGGLPKRIDPSRPVPRGANPHYAVDADGVIAEMDKATSAMRLTRPASMYRGIAMRPGFSLKPGDTFTDKGFTSLSSSRNWAQAFAELAATGHSQYLHAETAGDLSGHTGGTPAILHFTLPAGQRIGPGDADIGEYVMPRGTTYKVTGQNPDGSLEVTVAR